jgi:hypothetical protein
VVLDNLKEGVIKPDLYEPQLNAVYAAALKHYGLVGDPARVALSRNCCHTAGNRNPESGARSRCLATWVRQLNAPRHANPQ